MQPASEHEIQQLKARVKTLEDEVNNLYEMMRQLMLQALPDAVSPTSTLRGDAISSTPTLRGDAAARHDSSSPIRDARAKQESAVETTREPTTSSTHLQMFTSKVLINAGLSSSPLRENREEMADGIIGADGVDGRNASTVSRPAGHRRRHHGRDAEEEMDG
ncbi:unnamed protein product [Zymoseptoria tritici ST99CH_1A5]|uniref:Uncharacterized protein n=1 Tax=Zymoseptoria tritici ST99CH_1A5 TaxID=1276529 RepID=A0A1Y6M151_ZYMTR|nr:unnamed protein product [Zymoseptoria tritici ST99CH_1A5]